MKKVLVAIAVVATIAAVGSTVMHTSANFDFTNTSTETSSTTKDGITTTTTTVKDMANGGKAVTTTHTQYSLDALQNVFDEAVESGHFTDNEILSYQDEVNDLLDTECDSEEEETERDDKISDIVDQMEAQMAEGETVTDGQAA